MEISRAERTRVAAVIKHFEKLLITMNQIKIYLGTPTRFAVTLHNYFILQGSGWLAQSFLS